MSPDRETVTSQRSRSGRGSPDSRESISSQKSRSSRASPDRSPNSVQRSRPNRTSPQKEPKHSHASPKYPSREELAYAESHLLSPDRPEQYELPPSSTQNRISREDRDSAERKQSRDESLTDFSSTGRVSASDAAKTFSRKEIQETIDSVKQRWFGGADGGADAKAGDITFQRATDSSRPTSYHEDVGPRDSPQPRRPLSTSVDPPVSSTSHDSSDTPPRPMSSSIEKAKKIGGYPTSLEKLNSSLSDLQGEIMRLSLQQDAIKSHTRPDSEEAMPLTHAGQTIPSPRSDLIGGEPDVGTRPSVPVSSFGGTTVAPPPPTMYGAQYPAQPQPTYPYPGQYPGVATGFPPSMPGFFPQYQTSPMYGPFPQQQFSQPQQWGQPSFTQPPFTQPAAFQPSPNSPFEPKVPFSAISGPSSHNALMSPASVVNQPTISGARPTPSTPSNGQGWARSSPEKAAAAPSGGEEWEADEGEGAPMEDEEEGEEEGEGEPGFEMREDDPESEGFFIAFDAVTPKRTKPQLGKSRRKGKI